MYVNMLIFIFMYIPSAAGTTTSSRSFYISLSSEYGTYKTVDARLWLVFSGRSPSDLSSFPPLFVRMWWCTPAGGRACHVRHRLRGRLLPPGLSPQVFQRCALERIWDIYDSQGQIMAFVFRCKSINLFKMCPFLRSGVVRACGVLPRVEESRDLRHRPRGQIIPPCCQPAVELMWHI